MEMAWSGRRLWGIAQMRWHSRQAGRPLSGPQSRKPELACPLQTSFLLWQMVTAKGLQMSSVLRHLQPRTATQEQAASRD